MIKRIINIVLILCLSLCFALPAMADEVIVAKKNTATCTAYVTSDDSTGDYGSVGTADAYGFYGQKGWSPAENKIICRVDIKVKTADASAMTYAISIRTLTGTTLNAPAAGCASTARTATTTGLIPFTGLTCSVASGTSYAIVISHSDYSYTGTGIVVYYGADTLNIDGTATRWYGSDLTQHTDYTPKDMVMVIYAQ